MSEDAPETKRGHWHTKCLFLLPVAGDGIAKLDGVLDEILGVALVILVEENFLTADGLGKGADALEVELVEVTVQRLGLTGEADDGQHGEEKLHGLVTLAGVVEVVDVDKELGMPEGMRAWMPRS